MNAISLPSPDVIEGTYIADWITIDDLYRDPWTILKRLRAEGVDVPYVPAAGRYFVTRYDDVHRVDNDPDVFTADEEGSLMKRSQGHSMLRMDDPKHAVQRASYGGVLKPRAIKQNWNAVFERNFQRYFEQLKAAGPGADIVEVFAAPYAGANLAEVMGFANASAEDMIRWSQTMIDGTGNYADDPEVWRLAKESSDEVNIALDEMIERYRREPNASLISHIVQHNDPEVTLEDTQANIKMSIGGGINEPRDALSTIMWALFRFPDQREIIDNDPSRWRDAFEEGVRWIAPIGMYPRQTTRAVELGGTQLPPQARLGVMPLFANRDEKVFADPHRYNMNREKTPHLAFGGGQHFCAGAWIARTQVANIALPRLFAELPNLRLDPDQKAVEAGWVFRGMTKLPVIWDA